MSPLPPRVFLSYRRRVNPNCVNLSAELSHVLSLCWFDLPLSRRSRSENSPFQSPPASQTRRRDSDHKGWQARGTLGTTERQGLGPQVRLNQGLGLAQRRLRRATVVCATYTGV